MDKIVNADKIENLDKKNMDKIRLSDKIEQNNRKNKFIEARYVARALKKNCSEFLPEVPSYILFLDYVFPSIPKLSISLY